MHLQPFTAELLPAAAELLALRHQRQRAAEPLLPERFGHADEARKALTAAGSAGETSGVAAFDDSRLVGYILGTVKSDVYRGRHAWVELAGHAIAPDRNPELYRDLYEAIAARWVADGVVNHYAMVPAADRSALDAWFGISFAHQQVFGLRRLDPRSPPGVGPVPAGVAIRRAAPDDLELMLDVAGLITECQSASPCFAYTPPEATADWREGWAELLEDSNAAVWIAVQEGRVVSFAAFAGRDESDSDMLTGECACYLEVAATRPEARGIGLGLILAAHGLTEASKAGYTRCITDWRMANLLSSRFWPRQGFVPAACRLFRAVDPRCAPGQ